MGYGVIMIQDIDSSMLLEGETAYINTELEMVYVTVTGDDCFFHRDSWPVSVGLNIAISKARELAHLQYGKQI